MDERRLHQIFRISVLVKGAHAVLEIAGGIALAFLSTAAIHAWLGDFKWLAGVSGHFTDSEHNYYTFFFISHGIMNLILVIGLWREKLWAYPATFAVLTLFIAYQLYRYSRIPDPGLVILSLFDALVMLLAWNEYRLVKRRLFAPTPDAG